MPRSSSTREDLWRRRLELEHRSGVLRERLVEHADALQPAFRVVDQARSAGQWVVRHPWVPALIGGLWLARRPRRVLRLGWRVARGGFWVWRLAQAWQRKA